MVISQHQSQFIYHNFLLWRIYFKTRRDTKSTKMVRNIHEKILVRDVNNVDLSVPILDNTEGGFENSAIVGNLLNKHVQLKKQSKK